MQQQTRPLTRDQIQKVFPTLRGVIAFENIQGDISTTAQIFSGAPFITTEADADLGSERVLTGSDNVTVTDGGAGGPVTLDLTDTGVTPGPYGAETKTISITVDEKGRITATAEFDLNTDNITEGIVNLFFTVARARAAISGASGVTYNSTTGVATLDQSFTRGLFSGAGQVDYNSSSGVIDTTGFTGTVTPPLSLTFVNGICTAAT